MSKEFGELVRTKLAQRGLSQRWLAKMTNTGVTTINYLIRGRRSSLGTVNTKPGASTVREIARVLGIPVEEALRSAGHDPETVSTNEVDAPGRVYKGAKPKASVGEIDGDRSVFDIAYEAALAAIRGQQPTVQDGETGPKTGVTIEIPGEMRIVLLDVKPGLADRDIQRYRQAFLSAYRSVREKIG